jgi:MerR family redox-sensitive transcriptional activator SoxR
MPDLTIGEIARSAGIRTSTIRYYERIGLLPKPPRAGGRRRYDASILERLAMVRFAKQVGFSVAEIKILLGGVPGRPPPERWRKLAHEKLTQVDRLISDASAVRQLLLDTLDRKCPKLVERGRAIARATISTGTAVNWPNRPTRRARPAAS